MDCSESNNCELNCASSSEFPYPCFSARQFYGSSTTATCNTYCEDFVSQIENTGSTYTGTVVSDSDYDKLDTFASNLEGLHWSWFTTSDPCESYVYSGDGETYYLTVWYGLECDYEDGGVVEVRLSAYGLTGEVDLTSLPDTLEVLNLRFNDLSGSIETDHLGDLTKELYLSYNEFTGSVYFTETASYGNLYVLEMQNNQLSGSVDLTYAPSLMYYWAASDNNLEGLLVFVSFCLKPTK